MRRRSRSAAAPASSNWPRDARRLRRTRRRLRRGCAGGARSSTSALVYVAYSTVRNTFGSSGGDAVDPEPAFNHAKAIIDIQEALGLYFEPHLQSWYLDLPADGLIRLWNIFYGARPLRRHRGRADLALPRATRCATRCGATRSRSRRCSRSIGFAASGSCRRGCSTIRASSAAASSTRPRPQHARAG